MSMSRLLTHQGLGSAVLFDAKAYYYSPGGAILLPE